MFAGVLMIFMLTSCKDLFLIDIKYEVTGTANSVDISYQNKFGSIETEKDVTLPWSYEFKVQENQYLVLSATKNVIEGSVKVTIYKKGDEWKTRTKVDDFATATVTGST